MPLRRALLAGVLAAIFCAAPAAALQPSPSIFTFDTFPQPGAALDSPTSCGVAQVASGGFDNGRFARITCGRLASTVITLDQNQTMVELFVRGSGSVFGTSSISACGPIRCDGDLVVTQPLDMPNLAWVPVTLSDPSGAPTIRTVIIDSAWSTLDVDDVGTSSTLDQPDTEITAAPPATTSATTASFAFRANQPGAAFTCTFAASAGCASPASFAGLGLGAYRFSVAARDRWGRTDPTPASTAFTVVPPDADGDAVPDATDNCPSAANPRADGHRRRQDRRRVRGAAVR